MAGLATLDRGIGLLARGLAFLGGVCLLLMMVQTVADVVSRLTVNAPVRGNLEVISYYYMTAVVFLPLAFTERRFEHISVDMAVGLLPRAPRNVIYALTSVLAAAFFALLAYQTFRDAWQATERGEILMGAATVSVWPPKWFLPVGFGVSVLVCLSNAVKAFAYRRSFDPAPAPPAID